MADNYTQATVIPDIPKSALTDKEWGILSASGFTLFEFGDKTVYLVVKEGFILDDDYDLDLGDVTALELFHKIIKNTDIEEIVIEGAYTCSKMRSGEFGGFVTRITKDGVESFGTSQALDRMRAGTL